VIDPTQIRQKSERRYAAFLNSILTGENFFPIEFSIGIRPKDYIALREAVTQLIQQSKLKKPYGYSLELETQNLQKHGLQSLPKRISIDTEQDYLKFIKKEKEVAQFKIDADLIQKQIPELSDWLCRNPLKVIEYSDRWHDLLQVCQYFQQNSQPNLYIRELPIRVHTKFIEQNQKILRTLLEAILPAETLISVEGEKEDVFEKRFSLKYREPLIRLRVLDPSLKAKYSFPVTDMSLPITEFRSLNLEHHNCFITENLMNFLTLPPLENSFALFGRGYAVQVLKSVPWLLNCPIFYWGDLDADGFKILSQLRSYFPQTISIMMDRETFEIFHEFAVSVEASIVETLPHLTAEEIAMYSHLVLHQKRLEQERVSQDYANRFLHHMMQQNCRG
jgi:hypothetical protein